MNSAGRMPESIQLSPTRSNTNGVNEKQKKRAVVHLYPLKGVVLIVSISLNVVFFLVIALLLVLLFSKSTFQSHHNAIPPALAMRNIPDTQLDNAVKIAAAITTAPQNTNTSPDAASSLTITDIQGEGDGSKTVIWNNNKAEILPQNLRWIRLFVRNNTDRTIAITEGEIDGLDRVSLNTMLVPRQSHSVSIFVSDHKRNLKTGDEFEVRGSIFFGNLPSNPAAKPKSENKLDFGPTKVTVQAARNPSGKKG